jgi:hypothetical protein
MPSWSRAGFTAPTLLTMMGGFSTVTCTPGSLAQEPGLGLGAQAGEARLHHVFTEAGFGSFRQATATPFNLVLEAKP